MSLRGLVLSCHPLPTAGVTAISAGLAAVAGLEISTGALFTVAVFVGQLSIGWSNDWIDAARDRVAGRDDKPVASGVLSEKGVSLAAIIALVPAAVLSAGLGVAAGIAAMTLVASGWVYNLGLKGTVLSFVPYAVGFGALPAAATLALPTHPWPAWWAITAGAVLGLAAHAANVLPDLKADRATGVHGLWHRLGPRTTATAGPVLLVIASAVILIGPGQVSLWKWAALLGIAVVAGLGLVVGLRAPAGRVLFLAGMALTGIDLALFAISGSSLY